MSGGICFRVFICLFIFLPDNDVIVALIAIFCLMHYSFLSVMKINVRHSIEQRTIDASIDQWYSRLKTCICANGGHFKHIV